MKMFFNIYNVISSYRQVPNGQTKEAGFGSKTEIQLYYQ